MTTYWSPLASYRAPTLPHPVFCRRSALLGATGTAGAGAGVGALLTGAVLALLISTYAPGGTMERTRARAVAPTLAGTPLATGWPLDAVAVVVVVTTDGRRARPRCSSIVAERELIPSSR